MTMTTTHPFPLGWDLRIEPQLPLQPLPLNRNPTLRPPRPDMNYDYRLPPVQGPLGVPRPWIRPANASERSGMSTRREDTRCRRRCRHSQDAPDKRVGGYSGGTVEPAPPSARIGPLAPRLKILFALAGTSCEEDEIRYR
ncbi:hypothetical protein AXG93_815s1550 [Marchantia polymorpha subsp. ruderalis]|uniref:Uncharacterized protein n=1 Tax=Marchantia polymorpha subsp. ruderalis TaxID=1480154 RepID=A0A176W229_MARPO|nr:hypothetical protein AXG93_815s1550 [Marchantia polymorpha subsp. ruderalis]